MGSVRCGWELSVLVFELLARRDGLEVGKLCVAAVGWGVWCGIADGVCASFGMWGGGVGCSCAVMARCGRGAGESNVWASDLDSGDRLAAFACAGCAHLPPL